MRETKSPLREFRILSNGATYQLWARWFHPRWWQRRGWYGLRGDTSRNVIELLLAGYILRDRQVTSLWKDVTHNDPLLEEVQEGASTPRKALHA